MLEMNAAKLLRSLLLEFEDDQLVADSIEGETNLKSAVHGVLKDMLEDEVLLAGLATVSKALAERAERIGRRYDRRKAAILKSLELAEVPKYEFPEATISLRRIPPGLLVDDAAKIPAQFWKPQDPVLDRNALKSALTGGKTVEGCSLSNGGQTVTIRRG